MSGNPFPQNNTVNANPSDNAEPSSFAAKSVDSARGVIVTDGSHRIQYTDSRICSLLGVEPSELSGRDILDVAKTTLKHHFRNPEDFERRIVWLYDNPLESSEDVMEVVTPAHRVLHRYSTPLLDENGQSSGRIEVYSDITKRRELEDTNAGLYKQIRTAYDELQAAQDQLLQSEKLRAIGEIASGVAHDFNNTLGIILGNIQLLLRVAKDEKMRSRLQAVEQAALDGAETVRRIREFTKIQPDEPLSTIDLSAMVLATLDVMRPSWESSMQALDKRIEINTATEDGVLALGIAAEVREVLANIVLNAVQAMPDGGAISVSTGNESGNAWVKISDSGIGMPDDVKKRVFDPFFTTKGVKGTGLGMSVAYGIIKRHNGRITIDSAIGEGTTITIFLPATQEVVETTGDGPDTKAESVSPVRILIVDDEEMFAQVFMDMLAEHGHKVCVAGTGSEAIERFKIDRFDLVFTDLGMPEMSGWQVARGIKEIQPNTPVVLLTGWGAKVDEERLAESQVDMVLSKPIKMEDLAGIISRVLAGNEGN